VIVEQSMHPGWLSNSWLVADEPGGEGVIVDAGGPSEPILSKVAELGLSIGHVLCTHHHGDHTANNGLYRSRLGSIVCGHALERELFRGLDRELADGEELAAGSLRIRALHLPGHTVGQLGFLVDGRAVFTGDTLFRGTVGGTVGPGHATFDDLSHSIMEVLMKLPAETAIYPGHSGPTSIGEEWESNPFIRLWRGLDSVPEKPCVALGRPATLLLRAMDYDGGTKCQVRFDFDGGGVEIVPGSRVSPG
jgi:glyoxylase-like metal-dependent hydrolase (beta-lactamase superfamily II)